MLLGPIQPLSRKKFSHFLFLIYSLDFVRNDKTSAPGSLKEEDFIVSSEQQQLDRESNYSLQTGSCISTDEIVGLGNLGGGLFLSLLSRNCWCWYGWLEVICRSPWCSSSTRPTENRNGL